MVPNNTAAWPPRDGDIYQEVFVGGHNFTIRYGYASPLDRENGEPIKIFPDFSKAPLYTAAGYPLCVRIQDACCYYDSYNAPDGDGWCADCNFYSDEKQDIGVCRCEKRRLNPDTAAAKAAPD